LVVVRARPRSPNLQLRWPTARRLGQRLATASALARTTLGEPSPGFAYPQAWLDQMNAWSRHNVAFGTRPGVLWNGTPAGTLVEVDLDTHRTVQHEVLAGSRVTAIDTTATRRIVVAGRERDLLLLSVPDGSPTPSVADGAGRHNTASAFIQATSDLPDDDDIEAQLTLTRRQPNLGARRLGDGDQRDLNGPELASDPGSRERHPPAYTLTAA
jgi:hypothetical protein